jgi:hypothetical protein
MQTAIDIKKRLEGVFDKSQAVVLSEVITEAYSDLVKTGDFNELKEIVRELAITQKELAEAQKRTEVKVGELADDIKVLAKGLNEIRGEVGGLSRSMSYALENEAYRMMPELLKSRYDIELKERLIRTEIGDKEINIFGRAKRNGEDVLIVGEVKLRLDDRRKKKEDIFEELEEKVKIVKAEYGEENIIKLLITHYATKGFIKKAKDKGVIVIQTFEL